MSKSLFSWLAAAISVIQLFGCASQKPGPGPLPLSEMKWGAKPEAIEAAMKARQWSLTESSEGKLVFQLPAETMNKTKDTMDLFEPASITFFFHDNRMKMIRQKVSAPVAQMDKLQQLFIEQYQLDKPARTQTPVEKKSATGNLTTEESAIYQGSGILVRIFRERVKPVEEKMKDAVTDQLEVQVFSIAENPNISVDALSAM